MKQKRWLALALALILLAALFSGCTNDPPAQSSAAPDSDTAEQSTVPVTEAPDPAAEYAGAAARLEAAPDLTMRVEITEERSIGSDSITETTSRTARFQCLDGDHPVVHVSDLIVNGNLRAAFELTWADGTLFAKIRDARFFSREKLDRFRQRQLPAVLLHPENYGSVSREGDEFRFSEPLKAESWAMPEDAVLQEASASAVVKDGILASADYEIRFRSGGCEVRAVYHAETVPAVEEELGALVPESRSDYIAVDDVEAALLLYRARQAAEKADDVSTQTVGSIYLQAIGGMLLYTTEISSSGREDDYIFRSDETFVYVNASDQSRETSRAVSSFFDGVYDEDIDGEKVHVDSKDASVPNMAKRIRESVFPLHYQLLPTYSDLADVKLTDAGDYVLVEFSGNDAYCAKLRRELNTKLFNDPTRLDALAGYRVRELTGYTALDKVSCLPTAFFVNMDCDFLFDGEATRSSMRLYSALRFYDPDAYAQIAGEALPDEEPEEKAAPLLYEVTDPDGGKLYLFGTIHVGDARTAFLPQSVYDAFDRADALAVEFDTGAFTEQMEHDDALKSRIEGSYVYTDGSRISDHIGKELYDDAVLRMKAAGLYSDTVDLYKPFVWSQQLENFYLSQGRRLLSSKGVDNRLMERARAQEKEILSVESGEFQIELLSSFSDKVQQMLLEQSVSCSRNDYLASAEALFELWCAGDEQALRDYLRQTDENDREGLSEEELAAYDEYWTKLSDERNENMLQVAQGYLESGKTVFFAVGLAHLLADSGLVDALREAGCTVTRIG